MFINLIKWTSSSSALFL